MIRIILEDEDAMRAKNADLKALRKYVESSQVSEQSR